MLYSPNIHRCEHIKINGTQCGVTLSVWHCLCGAGALAREASARSRRDRCPHLSVPDDKFCRGDGIMTTQGSDADFTTGRFFPLPFASGLTRSVRRIPLDRYQNRYRSRPDLSPNPRSVCSSGEGGPCCSSLDIWRGPVHANARMQNLRLSSEANGSQQVRKYRMRRGIFKQFVDLRFDPAQVPKFECIS